MHNLASIPGVEVLVSLNAKKPLTEAGGVEENCQMWRRMYRRTVDWMPSFINALKRLVEDECIASDVKIEATNMSKLIC